METIKEILEYVIDYKGSEGEDGGIVIQDLKELAHKNKEGLTETWYVDLGTVKHWSDYEQDPMCGSCRLELYIFENKEYKFICIEDTEVEVSAGGTCYSGSVEVYRKGGEKWKK